MKSDVPIDSKSQYVSGDLFKFLSKIFRGGKPPLAYPGYDWMSQAVSDLSAANAPSLMLWNRLSCIYDLCTLICAMMVCVGISVFAAAGFNAVLGLHLYKSSVESAEGV